MKKDKEKTLHGNQAKIDPRKNIAPLFLTNSVTQCTGMAKDGVTPIVGDDLVKLAKESVDENHK